MMGCPVLVRAMTYGFWDMMNGWDYGFGLAHMLFWLVLLIAIIVGVVWLVRSLSRSDRRDLLSHRSAGLDVLEERYARGEISRDEYLEKKQDLTG